MNTDFERASLIQDGYWYTFKYNTNTTGFDRTPYVYCVQPDLRNPNNVICINLHHLPVSQRAKFLVWVQSLYHINNDDDVRIYNWPADDIKNLLYWTEPAFRCYNRKKIGDLYRIKAKDVGKYIEYEGDILGKDPKVTVMNKYWGEEYGKSVAQ